MTDRRKRDEWREIVRRRFGPCGCPLCSPRRREETDRDRMRDELDRLGIEHNLNDEGEK